MSRPEEWNELLDFPLFYRFPGAQLSLLPPHPGGPSASLRSSFNGERIGLTACSLASEERTGA